MIKYYVNLTVYLKTKRVEKEIVGPLSIFVWGKLHGQEEPVPTIMQELHTVLGETFTN